MIVDGWLDWATRVDGVADKVYSQPNTGEWITCHSIVGEESASQDGIPNRFLSTARNADGSYTADAAASCMFILRKSGQLIQMHPVWASTWTSGGREANTRSWAIEAEGGGPADTREPLTGAQVASFAALVAEWETHTGRTAVAGVTLLQHKDVAARFGYAPTACASDRYAQAWEVAEYPKTEASVTRTEYEDLILALFAGSEEVDISAPYAVLPRAERLAAAMYRVQLRAEGTERSVADIAASAAASGPTAIPDHRHEMSLVVAQTGGVKRS